MQNAKLALCQRFTVLARVWCISYFAAMWEAVIENACHSLNESQCSAVEHASCMQVMAKGHALYLSIFTVPICAVWCAAP